MTPERIDELLQARPPDEPDYRGSLEVERQATEPVRRGPVRPTRGAPLLAWSTAIVTIIVVAALGLLLATGAFTPAPSAQPSSSAVPEPSALAVIPWLDATPAPIPAAPPTPDPASYEACASQDLALLAGGWSGATGSMGGGIEVVNVSRLPCRIGAYPSAVLLDADGKVLAEQAGGAATESPGIVGMLPGGNAGATLVWENWCGTKPSLPLRVRVTLPGAGTALTAQVRQSGPPGGEVPRCDVPNAGSRVGVVGPLTAPAPSSAAYPIQSCPSDAIAAFSGGWGAAAGSMYAPIVVANVSGFDCQLAAAPAVRLLDARGNLLATSKPGDTRAWGARTVPAGWTALGSMYFADWCGASPALPLHLDLTVAENTQAVSVVPVADPSAAIPIPGCMSVPQTTAPSFGWSDPLVVPGAPTPPEPNQAKSLPLRVSLALPAHAAAGSVMAYTVRLTNVDSYGKPINLAAECPTYIERLYAPGATSPMDTQRLLNCAPVGILDPGRSATLEMRLQIPADAPSGTATLIWLLGDQGPAAKVGFEIGA